MGISGFFPRMKEAGFASVDKEIGQSGNPPTTLAIIDGPAFAHNIFRLLETQHATDGTAGRSIGTSVTYGECAEEAVKWLKQIEEYGFEIRSIFFDGALPASKLPVRRGRLNRYAKNLDVYRKLHERALKGSGTIGDIGQLKRARHDLAPPPFLVSAVCEALVVSQYSEKTFTVPGEADSFCIAAARKISKDSPKASVIIFTNDSDLAVYRPGAETKVVLLNTIEWRTHDDCSRLLATEYCPAFISSKAKCTDLMPLAFFLSEDRQLSVRKALARIQSGLLPSGTDFDSFAAQYNVDEEERILAELQTDDAQRQRLLNLDARVAEVVLQIKNYKTNMMEAPEFNMFLPFLLENSERTSAWKIGMQTRNLAYMLLLKACNCHTATIYEHRRVGDRVSPWVWNNWDFATLEASFISLHGTLERQLNSQNGLSRHEEWKHSVVHVMMLDYQALDLRFPVPEQLVDVLLCQPCDQWTAVELTAHFQAAFYSLRMLSQVLRYVRKVWPATMTEQSAMLLRLIEEMPRISDFFQPEPELKVGKSKWLPVIMACFTQLEPDWRPEAEPRKKKRKRRREEPSKNDVSPPPVHIGAAESEEEDTGASLKSNPFAALAGQ